MVQNIGLIDAAIVVGYMVACLMAGVIKAGQIKSIKDYAVGDRNFSTLVLVSTLFATFVSASRIGEVSAIYTYGIIFAVPFFSMPLNWLLVKYIYARNIWRFKGCISMSEIMQQLYGDWGRYVTNIAALVNGIGILTIQAVALGLLMEYFFAFSFASGVIIGMLVITIYSSLGGIRAVAITDVMQFFIFFAALPTACIYGFQQVGSVTNLVANLSSLDLSLHDNAGSLQTFYGFSFWMLMPILSGPYIQRLLMSKNQQQLNKSYNIIIMLCLLLVVIMVLLAFMIKILYPSIAAKYALYHFIAGLPNILMGLMIAGMLAVIMSSADSWLNNISILIVNDMLKNQLAEFSNKRKLQLIKLVTCLCGVLVVAVAISSQQEIIKLDLLTISLSFPLYFIPMTAGFLGFKSGLPALLGSIICGFLGFLLAKYQADDIGTFAMLYGMIGSAIGFFAVHYVYQYCLGSKYD